MFFRYSAGILSEPVALDGLSFSRRRSTFLCLTLSLDKQSFGVGVNFEIGLLDKELVENLCFVKVKCQGLAVFLFQSRNGWFVILFQYFINELPPALWAIRRVSKFGVDPCMVSSLCSFPGLL